MASVILYSIINPGIINKKNYPSGEIKNMDISKYKFCNKCNIYIPKDLKTLHCRICKVCVIERFHHDSFFGKCSGIYTIPFLYSSLILLTFHFGIYFYLFCAYISSNIINKYNEYIN